MPSLHYLPSLYDIYKLNHLSWDVPKNENGNNRVRPLLFRIVFHDQSGEPFSYFWSGETWSKILFYFTLGLWIRGQRSWSATILRSCIYLKKKKRKHFHYPSSSCYWCWNNEKDIKEVRKRELKAQSHRTEEQSKTLCKDRKYGSKDLKKRLLYSSCSAAKPLMRSSFDSTHETGVSIPSETQRSSN